MVSTVAEAAASIERPREVFRRLRAGLARIWATDQMEVRLRLWNYLQGQQNRIATFGRSLDQPDQ